ncbi:MAG: pentapeptide repeat-containing protein [SAR324 cluster bacterium]|nr:pentapeptide repeat-containing protein [SAR324 cluster bacterium]
MKLALEISFYGFLFISLVGVFLLVMLFRWIFGEKDILASFPESRDLPTPALEEARKLLKKMREHVPHASPARRKQLLQDLDLMDRTVQEIEFRTTSRESNYRKLCEEREEAWESLKAMVDQMSSWERFFGKNKNFNYIQGLQFYKNLSDRIEDAAEHVKFQGEMLLAELRNRGVYQQNSYLLYPKQKQASEEETTDSDQKIPGESASPDAPNISPNEAEENSGLASEPPKKSTTEAKNEETTADMGTESSQNVRPQLKQEDFPRIGINLKRRKYVDPTFNMDFEESGILRFFDFENCIFRGVNFTGLHQYDHCQFRETDFSGTRWFQVLQPHRFDHCDFTAANFTDSRFTFTAFYYCRFDRARWSGIKFKKVKFVSCSLEGVQWDGVDLSQTVFSYDMLNSLDFSNCDALPQNHPDRKKTKAPATDTNSDPLPPVSTESTELPDAFKEEKKQDSQTS